MDPILLHRPRHLLCLDFVGSAHCSLCHGTGHGNPPMVMLHDSDTDLPGLPDEARLSGLRISRCCAFQLYDWPAPAWLSAIQARTAAVVIRVKAAAESGLKSDVMAGAWRSRGQSEWP